MSIGFEPPSRAVRWSIVRLEPKRSKEAIITNRRFLAVGTHFYKQTYLCAGNEDCALCVGSLPRTLYYCSAIAPQGGKRGLLEFSPTSSADLEQACRLAGAEDLLGCHVRLERKGVRKGVYSEVLGLRPDIREVGFREWVTPLMFIFGMPAVKPYESTEDYFARIQPVIRKRAEIVAAKIPGYMS